MLCCQRQIASILGEDLEQVCSQMEELGPLASTEGCSAHLLLDFATEKGYGLVCLHSNRPTMTRMGNPILAFNIVDRHAYFYKSQVVARQVMKWGGLDQAASSCRSTTWALVCFWMKKYMN